MNRWVIAQISSLIRDAEETGCDPFVHVDSDLHQEIVAGGVELSVVQGSFALVPMWLAKAVLTYNESGGYAGLTLGEYVAKLVGE